MADRELFLERTSAQRDQKTTVERRYLIHHADVTFGIGMPNLNADGKEAVAEFIVHVANLLAIDDELRKQVIVAMDRQH